MYIIVPLRLLDKREIRPKGCVHLEQKKEYKRETSKEFQISSSEKNYTCLCP